MHNQLAVIFDMDGVIIDSNPLIAKAWTSFFAGHGISLTPAHLTQYVYGRTAQDTFQHVFQRALPADEVQAYSRQIGAHMRALYQREGTIVPGLGAFVAPYKPRTCAWGWLHRGPRRILPLCSGSRASR